MKLTAQQANTIKHLYGLSSREAQLVGLFFDGIESSKNLAEHTGLSVWTVKVYLRHIYMKLGCKSKLAVVLKIASDLSMTVK